MAVLTRSRTVCRRASVSKEEISSFRRILIPIFKRPGKEGGSGEELPLCITFPECVLFFCVNASIWGPGYIQCVVWTGLDF